MTADGDAAPGSKPDLPPEAVPNDSDAYLLVPESPPRSGGRLAPHDNATALASAMTATPEGTLHDSGPLG